MTESVYPAPTILIGFQRSGTTAFGHVLANLFASGGGMFTVNGKLLYYLRRWLTQSDLDASHFRYDEIQHALLRIRPVGPGADLWLNTATTALTKAAIEVWARPECFANPQQLTRWILNETYKSWSFWGEKYNENMLDINYIEETLEFPKYLYIFRKPADVVASMLSWSPEKAWNPRAEHAAYSKWHAWNSTALQALASIPRERVLVVEYGPSLTDKITRMALGKFLPLPLAENTFDSFIVGSGNKNPPPFYPEISKIYEQLRSLAITV
jgi:Sulfotransferase family